MKCHQEALYQKLELFWVLRDTIEKLLKKEATHFFGFWDELERPAFCDTKMPPSSAGPESLSTRRQLSGESKANFIQAETERAIQSIVKLLCSENTGAIPVPIDDHRSTYQPYEEVHTAAMALFEAMALASFRAQSIYTDPNQDRLTIIGKAKREELLTLYNIPSSFIPAPFDIIETHYASFDAAQIGNLDVFGPGSLAYQKRKAIVNSKRSRKKKPSMLDVAVSAEDILSVSTTPKVLAPDTPDQGKGGGVDDPIEDF